MSYGNPQIVSSQGSSTIPTPPGPSPSLPGGLSAVTVTGLPTLGQVLTATGPDAANWQNTPSSVINAAVLARAVQVGGDITVAATAGVAFELDQQTGGPGAGGLDVSLPAGIGDILSVALSAIVLNNNTGSTQAIGFDLATMVGGAPQSWLGQCAGHMNTNNGLDFQTVLNNNYVKISAALNYVVQGVDLSGGVITLRPYFGSSGALVCGRSVTSGPFILSASNLKH